MVDHVNIPVREMESAKRFYEAALAPLGYRCLMRDGDALGFGVSTWSFGLVRTDATFPPVHIAFAAQTREAVTAFHAAALAAGGRDNGQPGFRRHYDPNYFAAFVLDLDGHNVEAVCRNGR
ncbi:MAG TPA: glyoxalase/bleomycin resistance/extradiol dioxygenase family protein [Hyphomonadaceae bacterium]|nr:glyoxalase/bleomycin resistance/extradiol dioxygenase family protein [Hyphomonadaceae bacterium]